jgi:hypothetical protein
VYFLSFLLLMTVGGAFHSHEANPFASAITTTVYLSQHICNNHSEHSELPHNHKCQICTRIAISTVIECGLSLHGSNTVLDEIAQDAGISYAAADFLKISRPRSPPVIG